MSNDNIYNVHKGHFLKNGGEEMVSKAELQAQLVGEKPKPVKAEKKSKKKSSKKKGKKKKKQREECEPCYVDNKTPSDEDCAKCEDE